MRDATLPIEDRLSFLKLVHNLWKTADAAGFSKETVDALEDATLAVEKDCEKPDALITVICAYSPEQYASFIECVMPNKPLPENFNQPTGD